MQGTFADEKVREALAAGVDWTAEEGVTGEDGLVLRRGGAEGSSEEVAAGSGVDFDLLEGGKRSVRATGGRIALASEG